MSKITGLWTRLHRTVKRNRFESEMAAEMRHHIEAETDRRIAAGEDPATARRLAAAEFGSIDARTEEVRDHRLGERFTDFTQSVRFALRRLGRTPAFTATALATLALCIGANIAIFAVIDALVLRPLPFPQSERLVTIFNSYPGAGNPRAGSTIPNYFTRREAIDAFDQVALFDGINAVVGEPGNLQKIPGARVTPEFFDSLKVPLAMGQMFTDAELTYQTAAVVVLTHELWQSHFNTDPNILGQSFIADGLPSTIIGVLPPEFRFLSHQALFFKPLAFNPPERALTNRHHGLPGMTMIGRLAPGATLLEAQTQLDALNIRQAEVDPNQARLAEWDFHSLIRPLHADYIREIRPTLLLLQGGVLLLLLIGAVNLTNLLLVRASGRGREFAVRQALGARRSHLARDAWLETSLLALGGGVLGLGLGAAGVQLLATLGASELPLGATIAFDGRVAAISLSATLVLGSLLSVGPIWFLRRLPINHQLQSDTAGSTATGASQRLRQVFGMMQIALAFVLLCGTALLGVSLHRALAQPTGFTPDHILVSDIGLPWLGYRGHGQKVMFVWRIEQALRAKAGVSEVSVNNSLPFGGWVGGGPVAIENAADDGSETVRTHHHTGVTPGYWQVMGIPLLRGRVPGQEVFTRDAPRVCVIDQAMADRYWPDSDPIGQRLNFGPKFDPDLAKIIIGVVGTVKQKQLTETVPVGMVYTPFAQSPQSWFKIVVRTKMSPKAMAITVRETVAEIDPQLLIYNFTTMERMIEDSLQLRRSPLLLTAIFAGVALLLATIGTYGVLAYAVSHRRREIGVRMALGALPRQILQLFLGMGGRLLLGGLALGVFGSWATGRAMQRFLFDVAPFPPGLIAGVAALMGLVVLIAILLPAARAASIDPSETLRHE